MLISEGSRIVAPKRSPLKNTSPRQRREDAPSSLSRMRLVLSATIAVEIGYLDFLAHMTEEDLELYVMRMAPEADLERIEEHLLTCGECRDRLIETERVVAAFQAAAARIRDRGA